MLFPQKTSEFEQQLQDREAEFVRRDAAAVHISADDQRKLSSLGYVGGGGATPDDHLNSPDIKDMIRHFNSLSDAQLLMGESQWLKAAAILETVVVAVPNYFQAWFNLGVCRHELGNGPAAVSCFERAIEINENAATRIALSKVYLSMNQPENAIPHLEAAVRLAPDSVEASFLCGMSQRMSGNK